MDDIAISASNVQLRLLYETSVRVQRMALDTAKDQGAAILRMMDVAIPAADAATGNKVDILG